MTEYARSLCRACVHLLPAPPVLGLPAAMPRVCVAYPAGIPGDILNGDDHNELRGDEQTPVAFEKASGAKASKALAEWRALDKAVAEEAETQRSKVDDDQLHHYWTRGEGLAKWRTHPHPWTALRNHLRKHVPVAMANRMASQWFKEVFGYWPGSRKGSNPVGPG